LKRKIKETDVCREFGLENSTIQDSCNNSAEIISVFEQKGLRLKRFRESARSDDDERCLRGLGKGDVTVTQWAVLFA
jgi:hypothetical protein